ncbi:MAG TPA: homocysteine S-methyltransferase, partial [Gammaproteobacteria bacterium]|nr:homocysteine S-methyltransferase [Gammaproteobacteria bacterium]
YSTIPSYLGKSRLADRYEELTVLAAKMAREVADAADKEVL